MQADQLLRALWRRRLTALLTFVLVLGTAAFVTASLPKVYATTAYIIVSQRAAPESSFEATQVNQVLTRTYGELLQTRRIAERVRPELPFAMTEDELLAKVEVATVSESQLLSITAEGSSPERAQRLANVYAGVFLREARLVDVSGGGAAQVALAQSAPRAPDPIRPRPLLYLAIAAVLAAALAAGVALLRHRLDQRLELDATSTEVLGLPIIGYAPTRGARARARVGWQSDEAFRLLAANLTFVNDGRRPHCVAVVSSASQEGKSTSSFRLASAAAESGSRVLLVDADLRRPSVSGLAGELGLDVRGRTGLAGYLAAGGDLPFEELVVDVPGRSLSLVPTVAAPNAAVLLQSRALAAFKDEAVGRFDLVVFDTPPLTVGPDASLVATVVDGVVVVMDAGRTRRDVASRALEQLRRTDARILGVLLNRARELTSASYYVEDGRAARAVEPSDDGTPEAVTANRS